MTKVAKVPSVINLGSKYSQIINNADKDVAKDLRLTSIKKYQRYANQIHVKVDRLHKDQIPTLGTFVKYFERIHNNEKITKNMMIRCEIISE